MAFSFLPFIQNVGVPQVDTLSPLLFVLLTVDLIRKVREKFPELDIIMFADDIAIYAQNRNLLQLAQTFIDSWSRDFHLSINVDKKKTMKFRRGGRLSRDDILKLNGTELNFVNSFTYLGITLSSSGFSFEEHLRIRTRKSIMAISSIRNPRTLSIETALKLFALKIAPIACYGIQVIWEHLSLANLLL